VLVGDNDPELGTREVTAGICQFTSLVGRAAIASQVNDSGSGRTTNDSDAGDVGGGTGDRRRERSATNTDNHWNTLHITGASTNAGPPK
jgi:hypothetical protein